MPPPPGKMETHRFSEVKILNGSFMHKVKLTTGSSDHLAESYCAYNRRPYFNMIRSKGSDFGLRVQNHIPGWWNFPIKLFWEKKNLNVYDHLNVHVYIMCLIYSR